MDREKYLVLMARYCFLLCTLENNYDIIKLSKKEISMQIVRSEEYEEMKKSFFRRHKRDFQIVTNFGEDAEMCSFLNF